MCLEVPEQAAYSVRPPPSLLVSSLVTIIVIMNTKVEVSIQGRRLSGHAGRVVRTTVELIRVGNVGLALSNASGSCSDNFLRPERELRRVIINVLLVHSS